MGKTVFVFFDIGDTLASPVFSAVGRVEGLDVYPFVTDVLRRLNDASGQDGTRIKLGLISNTTGESAASMRDLLSDAGLLTSFEPHLLLFSSVEGLNKSDKQFFELACERATADASQCVFVGENEAERKVAASAHLHVSPHPLHVLHLVKEQFSIQ